MCIDVVEARLPSFDEYQEVAPYISLDLHSGPKSDPASFIFKSQKRWSGGAICNY